MRTIVALLLSLLFVGATSAAERHAHRHGHAELNVALQDQELLIVLEGPSDNVLGFERAPRTEEEKQKVKQVEEQLKQTAQLFELPVAARCEPQPARTELKLPAAGSKEQHSEVEAEWRWRCAVPTALTYVDVGLLKVFPRMKELRVQLITPTGQRAARLRPGNARLTLRQ
jgi:hypothetical protein